MSDILFLAHRIPYPPDKGDKIRSWHVLRHLVRHHRVHLVMFIDDPDDERHVKRLEALCATVFWRPLSRRTATIRSLRGLITGASLTEGYFSDAHLSQAVDNIVRRVKPGLAYIFSSGMAPYVEGYADLPVILDLVDVDSEKWRQYARQTRWPLRLVYSREARSLHALERRAATQARAVSLVTPSEMNLFIDRVPQMADRVHSIGNGVDTEYFDPALDFEDPFDARPAIVFTGLMDYRPNVDAMIWFAQEVMPRLRRLGDPPRLWIVGANPSPAIRDLASEDIHITGRVPDVRPYLKHARAVVVPLRIARGVQNKVIEAMAMGGAVVATPQIRQTLAHCQDGELLIAETAVEFADTVARVLQSGGGAIGERARHRVICNYRWEPELLKLDGLVLAATSAPEKRCTSPLTAIE